ncbi:uncharacterized protein HKW66_Vig0149620 [Vigna angularis]|uniref:Uncharacterized protein n=1 Tax=Phaseolus angularis TaxID=3914 RepID=A0A8T0JV67_PHAAN|nr:uncharacterized protein HKW66_Vig0149620 [Vigna angularis]
MVVLGSTRATTSTTSPVIEAWWQEEACPDGSSHTNTLYYDILSLEPSHFHFVLSFFLFLVEALDAYLEVEWSERTKVTLSFLKSVKAKGGAPPLMLKRSMSFSGIKNKCDEVNEDDELSDDENFQCGEKKVCRAREGMSARRWV